MARETSWTLYAQSLDGLQGLFDEYGANYGRVVDRVLHSPKATSELYRGINPKIPVSGRDWEGKGPAASSPASMWPQYSWGDMSVTIKPKPAYRYLYYPDDGRSSRRHQGRQFFFAKGGEEAAPRIAQLIAAELKDEIRLRAEIGG